MNTAIKRTFFTLLSLIAYLALLCSIAASTVLNESIMADGFNELPQENRQLLLEKGVSSSQYTAYAKALCSYLSGKGELCQVTDSEGNTIPAFEDQDGVNGESKQNVHLQDVRGITLFLINARYFGGGAVLAVLAGLYLFCHFKKKIFPVNDVIFGLAAAAGILLIAAIGTGIWAACDFQGAFIAMHKVLFPNNDYWLLNSTHKLMNFMPQSFFEFYAKKLLMAELPIIGIMVCMIIIHLRLKKEKSE